MRTCWACLVAVHLGFAPLLLFPTEASTAPIEPASTLVVEGTEFDLGETPILAEVGPQTIRPGRYRLRAEGSEAPLAAVVFGDQNQQYLGVVLPRVPARSTSRYTISPDQTPENHATGVNLIAQGSRVGVELDGKAWTTYIPDDGPKPFFDPLIGPSDLPLTRAWPMREVAGEPHDHPHHRSLWFAHFDVNKTNTWDQNPGHGAIHATTPPTILGGGPVGILRTTDDWLDKTGKKVCEDDRVVRFYATRQVRMFDFEVTLKATEGPLRIGDNKDGVFGIRLAASMAVTAKQGGHIVNSRGLLDTAAWGKAAEWVDYTGPVGGETMGVAILNQPTSFRFPTTWHVRDYGLFAANPFGWHDFGQANSGEHTVAAGESIRLAYRVILHRGATAAADIDAQFQAYATPPRVSLR